MKSSDFKEKFWQFFNRNLPVWLITIGMCLRLKHFLDNRSFWLDEAYVGIYVRIQGWGDILLNRASLQDTPVPPLGFMVFEKIASIIGGENEFALRFFPLIFGCLAIVVFYRLAKHLLPRSFAVFALGLFVFSDTLIYFSAEAKQYSLELLVAILFWLAVIVPSMKGGKERLWRPAVFGVLAVVFSHQIIFVMASYVFVHMVELIESKKGDRAFRFLITCSAWAAFWLFFFFSSYLRMVSNGIVIGVSESIRFLPLNNLMKAAAWLGSMMWGLFKNPGGLFYSFVPCFLFVFGGISLWKKDNRVFWLLFLPLMLAAAASGLKKYPFYGRLLMFVVPTLFIFIAEGARIVSEKTAGGRYKKIILCVLAVCVLAVPIKEGFRNFAEGRRREESRDMLCFVKQNFHEGDLVVMNYFGMRPFFYYFGRGSHVSKINMALVTNKIFQKNNKRYIGVFLSPVYFDPEANFYMEKDEGNTEVMVEDGDAGAFPQSNGRYVWAFFFHRYESKEVVLDLLKAKGLVLEDAIKRAGAELYVFRKK